jgi:hypothetical protein
LTKGICALLAQGLTKSYSFSSSNLVILELQSYFFSA